MPVPVTPIKSQVTTFCYQISTPGSIICGTDYAAHPHADHFKYRIEGFIVKRSIHKELFGGAPVVVMRHFPSGSSLKGMVVRWGRVATFHSNRPDIASILKLLPNISYSATIYC
jgi:hypothetical protein